MIVPRNVPFLAPSNTRSGSGWLDGEPEDFVADGLDDPAGFGYRCRWQVDGTVEHGGHIHQLVNQYDARFYVKPVAGVWKITALEVLDEQRIKSGIRLRKLKLGEPSSP